MKKITKKSAELTDDTNPEWSAEDFKNAVPFHKLPQELQTSLKRVRGPQKAPTKQQVTLRLDQDVVTALRKTGRGWQGRANAALRSYVEI